jgi:hypothetical protein
VKRLNVEKSVDPMTSVDSAARQTNEFSRVSFARAGVKATLLVIGAIALAACGGDEEEVAAGNPPGNPPAGNQAPTISGSPPPQVMQNQSYSFTPTASDANAGDTLSFSVQSLPGWATFNSATGRISGTPTAGDVGTYSNIRITVSDGQASANLAAFSVSVVATASGAATLSWNAPTQNTDGSPYNDAAGYRIYWGTSQGNYTNSHTLSGVGLQTYVVEPLTPGTWYFVVTAFDTSGNESGYSNVANKTL